METSSLLSGLQGLQGLLVALVGVGGVALGASLTGRRARLNAESARRYEKKTDSYLAAIDPAFQLSDQMRLVVRHTPRGGEDPDSDRIAGDAFMKVIEVRTQLDRHLFELRVLGSTEVAKAYDKLRTRTDDYMDEVARQLEKDGIFRGAPGQAYLDDLDDLIAAALLGMRHDLGVRATRPRYV